MGQPIDEEVQSESGRPRQWLWACLLAAVLLLGVLLNWLGKQQANLLWNGLLELVGFVMILVSVILLSLWLIFNQYIYIGEPRRKWYETEPAPDLCAQDAEPGPTPQSNREA